MVMAGKGTVARAHGWGREEKMPGEGWKSQARSEAGAEAGWQQPLTRLGWDIFK